MDSWAIVVAAGRGSRYGSRKQYVELAGRPLVEWTLEAARKVCSGVVLVVPADRVKGGSWDADQVVAGGETRSESVRAGLAAVPSLAEVVVVHDAARPLASERIWREVIAAVAAGADAAIPAIAVTDTVKRKGPQGRLETLKRDQLVAVQTPQAFRLAALRRAHAGGEEATDDAALVERAGGRVALVEGSTTNLKITSPSDLVVAKAYLDSKADIK